MEAPKTKFEIWLEGVQKMREKYYEKTYSNLKCPPLTYKKGKRYVKIITDRSVWGFVSMVDDPSKNERVGDLLKAASYKTPAKHARGNIFDGTARFGIHGPDYLK